jgi:hypothetical protein
MLAIMPIILFAQTTVEFKEVQGGWNIVANDSIVGKAYTAARDATVNDYTKVTDNDVVFTPLIEANQDNWTSGKIYIQRHLLKIFKTTNNKTLEISYMTLVFNDDVSLQDACNYIMNLQRNKIYSKGTNDEFSLQTTITSWIK